MKNTTRRATLVLALLLSLTLVIGLAGCGAKKATVSEPGSSETGAPKASGPAVTDFSADSVGDKVTSFVPMVGNWSIVADEGNNVLVVDGTGWTKGTVRPDLADQVKRAFTGDSAAFLTNVGTYSDYPFALENTVMDFTGGEISMRFKTISGEEDQGAGILFDVKPSGDYLTIRANPLENNIVMFEMKDGKRTKLLEIKDIPTKKGEWSKISIKIDGTSAQTFLDDKLVMETPLKAPVSGRVGIWSKADSHVMYDDYTVTVAK